MRTTIDSAGRIVIPKSIRDAMGLHEGRKVDVVFTNGRVEIEVAPARVRLDTSEGLPRLVPLDPMPPLTDEMVRDTVEATRR